MRILKIITVAIALPMFLWATNTLNYWDAEMIYVGLSFWPVIVGLAYGVIGAYLTKLVIEGHGPLILFFMALPAAILIYSFLIVFNLITAILASAMLISYTSGIATVFLMSEQK